ncbi:MAG: HAD family phosphatase [Desulfobacterales bacterium]|jgi:putative hydrolase of the HAD superfamily
MQAIRTVVFDLGKVLIDVHFERCLSLWSRYSGVGEGDIAARFRLDPAYEMHERGEIDAEAYFSHLRRRLQIDLSDDQFAEGWRSIIGGEIEGIRDALPLASSLGPLYVLTNTNALHESVWMEMHSDLLECFDGVFVSSRMGCRKPEAAIYATVVEETGTPPNAILFFDDSEENILGALEAGIQACRVASPEDVATALQAAIEAR